MGSLKGYFQNDVDRTEENDETVNSSLPESFFSLIHIIEDWPISDPQDISDEGDSQGPSNSGFLVLWKRLEKDNEKVIL